MHRRAHGSTNARRGAVATAPHQAVVQLECSAGFLQRVPKELHRIPA
jgi:hypothetical protein